MRDNSRWQLTDYQRLLVVLAVASAFFLSAIALGAWSIVPLLIAMVLLVGAGLGVFLIGLRLTARGAVLGHAYVVMAQPPPVGKIVGRCEMRLLVDLPGQAAATMKVRDSSVSVTKWPTVGMTLPVEISPRGTRPLRIRWELVDARTQRTAGPEEDPAFAVPLPTDYSDAELDGLTDNEYVTPSAEYFPPDPDTILGDEIIIPPHLSADLSPEVSDRASDFELPMRSIPQPRPAEKLPDRRTATPPTVSERGPEVDGQAMGMMLVVSDLNRSLRFYRDLVGFSVVDRGANVAVLAYGGGRVLLRQLADMSPVDRRVAHLHISVSDVDASYKNLKDRGIEFVHRPRVTSRGEKLDLWAATFRDPDGHDIALTQWQAREDAPPP